MRIEPIYVVSSNIQCAGHDGKVLYLRFKSGECYAYDGVSFTMFDALTKAESPGQYFHRFIKKAFCHEHLSVDPFTGCEIQHAA